MGRSRKLTGRELLEHRLAELSISQTDLASKLGVSTGTVSRWISGERTPSLEMAVRIERATGIEPASWLLPRTAA